MNVSLYTLELLSNSVRNPIFNLYTLYLTQFLFILSDAVKDLGIGVATESQRGQVTSPGPHSRSEAKLHFMWSQSPPVLVLPLLAIAKGWEFSSQSVFCDNPKSHTRPHRGHTIQGFFWAVVHLGQCWPSVQAVPTPGTSFLFALQLFKPPPQPSRPFRSCLLVSGGHSSMFPPKRAHIF